MSTCIKQNVVSTHARSGKIEKQHELRNNPRYKRDDTILKNGVEYSFGNTQQQTQQKL